MAELATALAAAALVATLAAGAGSVACAGARAWPAAQRWLLRVVLGLGILPLLLVVGHEVFAIPVRPLGAVIVGGVGLALAGFQEWRWRIESPAKGRGTGNALVLGLVLAIGLFFAAVDGLLGQPGFDGLDPWGHSLGAAFVADSGSLRQPDPEFPLIHYVDAYPPLYDVLLAIPVGVLDSNPEAVKGVASLLVAIAPLAIWLLALELWGDHRRAAIVAVLYAFLPSAVPRHVWGHSLAVVLGLAALSAAVALRSDRSWLPAAALSLGGCVLAAPSQGLKVGVLFALVVVVAMIGDRRWGVRALAAGVVATVVAAVWLAPAAARADWDPILLIRDMQPPELRRADDPLTDLPPGVEAPLPWAPKAHDHTGIAEAVTLRPHSWLLERTRPRLFSANVPAGLGLPLLVLIGASLVCWRRRQTEAVDAIVVAWLVAAAVLTFAAAVGVRLFPWRSWLLLAPTAALVASDGAARLARARPTWCVAALALAGAHALVALASDLQTGLLASRLVTPAWLVTVAAGAAWAVIATRRPEPRWWVVVAVVCCHLVVTAPVRAAALGDHVPPRVFYDQVEHRGYLELAAGLAHGTRVWPLSGGMRFEIVTGLALGCTPHRLPELAMARRCTLGDLPTVEELVGWLQQHRYQMLVLDPSFAELQQARGNPGSLEPLRRALDAHPALDRAAQAGRDQTEPASFVAWSVRPGAAPG